MLEKANSTDFDFTSMARYRIQKTDDGEDIYTICREGELLYWIPLLLAIVFVLFPFLLKSQREIDQTAKMTEHLEISNDVWQGGRTTTQDGKRLDLGAVMDCVSVFQESGMPRAEIEATVVDENNVFHPQCR